MRVEKNIPDDWSETSLDEICSKVTDGSHQSPKSFKGGLPMLSVKDMGDFGFDIKNSKKISNSDFNNLVRQGCKPEINDVLIAKDGSVLKHVFAVKKKINAVLLSSIAIVRPIPQKIVPEFLVYTLVNPRFKKYILNNFLSGSGVPRIVLKDFKKIELNLPSLPEQQAIAKVLTAFDDKIKLLQAQNKTLETMAQTIFKEWFGKYQIGDELPEGWSFSPLYSIARYINGSAFKAQDFSKDKTGLPIVKIAELKNGITDSTAFTKKVVDNKYYIDDGDILFSWSGSPETSIDIFLWSSGKAILNQHSFNVKVNDDNEKAWVYFLLKYKKSLFIHLAKMKQTTGLGHVTISDLKENYFATPPKDDRKRFGKVFNGFHQKIIKNQSQIQSLTKTRDTLLPKLMSGQVRVKNIKQTADA